MDKSSMSSEEKLQYILEAIGKGKSREEVAKELDYKNYRSMDTFLRRLNYTWDRSRKLYLLPEERNNGRYAKEDTSVGGKVGEVLRLFGDGDLTSKEIAEKLGFDNHRELGEFMTSKGYSWDRDLGNYYLSAEAEEDSSELEARVADDSLDEFLHYLLQHRNIIETLIEQNSNADGELAIPRYSVPGQFTTKSVHMSHKLAKLISDFSDDIGISQREIFEVSIIEMLQKYGYRKETETLLKNG